MNSDKLIEIPSKFLALVATIIPDALMRGLWHHPALIAVNNFVYKSLSSFSLNMAVGCIHGCLFCFVPKTSTIKLKKQLKPYGIEDPDGEWGNYALPRWWDEKQFLASLRKAENTPRNELSKDGNRAVMLSTTTDPYQVIPGPPELMQHYRAMVRRALELIRDQSTLNVRILTRCGLAKQDFDIMQSFGDRLLFGMSLPTTNNKLARVYEPHAPSPTSRLATLWAAKAAGLNLYVAIAPTYPECDVEDLRTTFRAIADLGAVTVYAEPINIRAENVSRIEAHARSIGVKLDTSVFSSVESWQKYAIHQLKLVESVAAELGLSERLHLWPDKSLGSVEALRRVVDPKIHQEWLLKWWTRISEWPSAPSSQEPVIQP